MLGIAQLCYRTSKLYFARKLDEADLDGRERGAQFTAPDLRQMTLGTSQ